MEKHKQARTPGMISAKCDTDSASVSAMLCPLYSITNWELYKKYDSKAFFSLSKYWSHYACVPQINTYMVKEKDMEHKGG